MIPLVSMREAVSDPLLFGDVLGGESWTGWRALLIAAMGEELTSDERAIFAQLTGRECEPDERVEELWAVVGRRGGKTRGAAVVALYLGLFVDWTDCLVPGEIPLVLLLGQNTRQADIARNYAVGILESKRTLRKRLAGKTAETVALSTGVMLDVRPASFRGLRGVTAVGVVADEIAFWHSDDSANPDAEILNAVRPALATTGGPLIAISSPYARRGELWQTYRRHYGPEGDRLILVAQGASRDFNPTLPQRVVDRAYERDPIAAGAEYGAEFRTDVEAFLSREAVEAVVAGGIRERPPVAGISYAAFCDPSGGSADSMTLAIAHRADGKAVLDALRECRPPFSPEAVVAEFADLLKAYGLHSVTGDRYAGEWPRERFREHGVTYEPAAKPKSDLYRDLLPAVNSGQVDLLDSPRLVAQLVGLERRTARSGKDSIDHAPGGHDDIANAAAGALVGLVVRKRYGMLDPAIVYGADKDGQALGPHDRERWPAAWYGGGAGLQ